MKKRTSTLTNTAGGKDIPDGIDLQQMLGKACLIEVTHRDGAKGPKPRIIGATPLPRGMPAPAWSGPCPTATWTTPRPCRIPRPPPPSSDGCWRGASPGHRHRHPPRGLHPPNRPEVEQPPRRRLTLTTISLFRTDHGAPDLTVRGAEHHVHDQPHRERGPHRAAIQSAPGAGPQETCVPFLGTRRQIDG
jgi:hypothetical protein